MDIWALVIGSFFSLVGFSYFVYGKKTSNFFALISGMIMMIYPYFVSSKIILLLIGLVLSALPFVF